MYHMIKCTLPSERRSQVTSELATLFILQDKGHLIKSKRTSFLQVNLGFIWIRVLALSVSFFVLLPEADERETLLGVSCIKNLTKN